MENIDFLLQNTTKFLNVTQSEAQNNTAAPSYSEQGITLTSPDTSSAPTSTPGTSYSPPNSDIDNTSRSGYNENKNGGEEYGRESTRQQQGKRGRNVLFGSGGRTVPVSSNGERSSQLFGIVKNEKEAKTINEFFKEFYLAPRTETQKDIAFLSKLEVISIYFATPRSSHENVCYFKDNLLIVNESITEKGYADILNNAKPIQRVVYEDKIGGEDYGK